MLRLKKLSKLPDGTSGTAQVAAQKYRDSTGYWDWWECGICRQRLPRLRKRMSAEIAGQHCKDCRDSQECLPRLPGLPKLPAESGWLQAEIDKLTRLPTRVCLDCRGCSPKMPILHRLLGVPNFQSEIAESHDQDCWDCDGDCRPILQRLQRLLGLPRMQLLARLPRSPRLSPEIDGITDFAGRGWVIARWD